MRPSVSGWVGGNSCVQVSHARAVTIESVLLCLTVNHVNASFDDPGAALGHHKRRRRGGWCTLSRRRARGRGARHLQPLRGLPRRRGARSASRRRGGRAPLRQSQRRQRHPRGCAARVDQRAQRRQRRRAPLRGLRRARVRRRRRGRDLRPGAPRARSGRAPGAPPPRARAPVPEGVAHRARDQDRHGARRRRPLARAPRAGAGLQPHHRLGATAVLIVGTGQYAATTLAALRRCGVLDVRVFSPVRPRREVRAAPRHRAGETT